VIGFRLQGVVADVVIILTMVDKNVICPLITVVELNLLNHQVAVIIPLLAALVRPVLALAFDLMVLVKASPGHVSKMVELTRLLSVAVYQMLHYQMLYYQSVQIAWMVVAASLVFAEITYALILPLVQDLGQVFPQVKYVTMYKVVFVETI